MGCVSLAWLPILCTLSKSAHVVLITWSPSGYIPVGPNFPDALPCILITTWQLVKAHGVIKNEPKIHVLSYITFRADTRCNLEYLPWEIYNKGRWWEKEREIGRESEREREGRERERVKERARLDYIYIYIYIQSSRARSFTIYIFYLYIYQVRSGRIRSYQDLACIAENLTKSSVILCPQCF